MPGPDRRGGERLARSLGQAGDVIVADNGSGDHRSVAWAVQHQADVGGRRSPAPCPLDTAAGPPFHVWRWRRQRGRAERAGRGGCRWQQQRDRVRLLATKCDAQTTQRARSRRRRKAQKAGRTLTAAPLLVAGWLWRLTTLAAARWSAADVLAVYRVRGPVARVWQTHEATAAAEADTQPAPHECGGDGASAPHGLGGA